MAGQTAVTFGEWLKQRRKELGLAQDELARRADMSLSMLRKIEAGERHPSGQIAKLLANYLRIPGDEQEAFIAFARSGHAAPPLPAEAGAAELRAPWRSAYVHLTNLPASLTPLIGREEEVAEVREQVINPRTRLLTLTGAPGIGKTRLALQVASDLLPDFENGVFFVDLAPLSDPLLVLPTVARTMGLTDEGKGGMPVERLLLNHLRDRRVLLVLDNFEQVLDAAFHLLGLMEGSPWLKLLTTSREPLHIRGERRFTVPPLALPGPERLPPEELARYSAVELFAERVRMSEPDFTLSGGNAEAVARICIRLDGLPLAIELAAGQVGFLSPQEIEERLTERLHLLRARERQLPERQRSLRGAIDSSYNLLSEQERALFRRLGVFEGGFTVDAARAVCPDVPHEGSVERPAFDLQEGLRTLLDKSLITRTQLARGERRLGMLETLHEYAREQLDSCGEVGEFRKRHCDYFLLFAQEAASHLGGPQQAAWLNRLEGEHDNMRSALEWLFEDEPWEGKESGEGAKERELERIVSGAQLCIALHRFWSIRAYYSEARTWFNKAAERIRALIDPSYLPAHRRPDLIVYQQVALSVTRRASPGLASLFGSMLGGVGVFAYEQCDFEAARAFHEAGLSVRRQIDDKVGIASSLGNLGNLAVSLGVFEEAKRCLTESLDLRRELGNDLNIAFCLNDLAIVECDTGNFERARSLYEESLALAEKLGNRDQMGRVLNNLGIVLRYQRDYGTARQCLERAFQLQTELGKWHSNGLTCANMALVARDEGRYDEARRYFLEGLAIVWEAGDSWAVAECLEGMASLAAVAGDASKTAMLFGSADALREAILGPVLPVERSYQEQYIALARPLLDPEEWSAAWSKGRAMSTDDVVQQLLSSRS